MNKEVSNCPIEALKAAFTTTPDLAIGITVISTSFDYYEFNEVSCEVCGSVFTVGTDTYLNSTQWPDECQKDKKKS